MLILLPIQFFLQSFNLYYDLKYFISSLHSIVLKELLIKIHLVIPSFINWKSVGIAGYLLK